MKFMITEPSIKLAKHQEKAIKFIANRKSAIINYD